MLKYFVVVGVIVAGLVSAATTYVWMSAGGYTHQGEIHGYSVCPKCGGIGGLLTMRSYICYDCKHQFEFTQQPPKSLMDKYRTTQVADPD